MTKPFNWHQALFALALLFSLSTLPLILPAHAQVAIVFEDDGKDDGGSGTDLGDPDMPTNGSGATSGGIPQSYSQGGLSAQGGGQALQGKRVAPSRDWSVWLQMMTRLFLSRYGWL